MGLLADANMIRQEGPSFGNVAMAGLGLLPFVPAASLIKKSSVLPQVPINGRLQYESFVEPVHVDDLLEMRGNKLGKTDLEKLKSEIKDAGGLQEPVIIQVGKNDRSAIVGEGNHRVQAAKELGYEYVPARVLVQNNTYGSLKHYWPDIKPKADEYFKSDAKPSEVFRNIRIEQNK
jgi:hypothetical protein